MIELFRLELTDDCLTTFNGYLITDGNLKSGYFNYELRDYSNTSLTSAGASILYYYREIGYLIKS